MTSAPFRHLEPPAQECSNPGHDDRWTCPGCYSELGDVGTGPHKCGICDRTVHCSIEQQPVCVASLKDPA